jgi:hypothetical protein
MKRVAHESLSLPNARCNRIKTAERPYSTILAPFSMSRARSTER